MDWMNLILAAISSGAGAFAGAFAAYLLACRKDEQHKINDYLTLLLMIHENLEPLYSLFSDIPPESVEEIDGEKIVAFDLPFPSLNFTPQQMQTLFEVSPDKDMPSALIHLQNFLNARSQRLKRDGVNILPLEEIRGYERQLKGMLLSVQVQYEQQAKSDFPLDGVIPHTPPQKQR